MARGDPALYGALGSTVLALSLWAVGRQGVAVPRWAAPLFATLALALVAVGAVQRRAHLPPLDGDGPALMGRPGALAWSDRPASPKLSLFQPAPRRAALALFAFDAATPQDEIRQAADEGLRAAADSQKLADPQLRAVFRGRGPARRLVVELLAARKEDATDAELRAAEALLARAFLERLRVLGVAGVRRVE